MTNEAFIDFYEVLELSTNANTETIERVFRYLAHRLHPDTSENNDKERFNRLVEAHNTLTDPEARAAYDVKYRKNQVNNANLVRGAEATETDSVDRRSLLSIFYAKRRRDMKQPGVGLMTLEEILGCPTEVLEFHIWYFREKGWVDREESGLLAITAKGVDEIEAGSRRWAPDDRLIGDAPHATDQVNSQNASFKSESVVQSAAVSN